MFYTRSCILSSLETFISWNQISYALNYLFKYELDAILTNTTLNQPNLTLSYTSVGQELQNTVDSICFVQQEFQYSKD